jgi:hypothetical protein
MTIGAHVRRLAQTVPVNYMDPLGLAECDPNGDTGPVCPAYLTAEGTYLGTRR